jgi:hypothetical protein
MGVRVMDLPLKFLIKLAKIPLYVGITFLSINLVLVFFTALRVNTLANTAKLVINENNFMPAHERRVIIQELANMGRPATVDRQGLSNPSGISAGEDEGSPVVGGWAESSTSLLSVGNRVQQGTVSEFEMFVWFRPYIPVFGNLFAVPVAYAPAFQEFEGYSDFSRHMLNEIGVVGGQGKFVGEFTVTDDSVGMFEGLNPSASAGGNTWTDYGGKRVKGIQHHLDAQRSWFDFRIGGCYRTVGLAYYPDLLFTTGTEIRGGCPSYGR